MKQPPKPATPHCATCSRPLDWMTRSLRSLVPADRRRELPLNGMRVCKNSGCPSSPFYSPSSPLTTTRQVK